MLVLGGLEDARGHRRRQGQGHERRDDHRAGHRHGELDEQPARLASLKRQRREHRHQGDSDRNDGKGDFLHRLVRGLQRFLPLLDVPEYVFEHDNGVVHHHPDGEHERKHGENVHRVAEPVEDRERADDGHGNRDGWNDRRTHVAQEQINHQYHEPECDAERSPDFFDRALDKGARVVVHDERDARRQRGTNAFHLGLDAVGDLDRVALGLFDDPEEDARFAVVAGDRPVVFHPGFGAPDVAQAHDLRAVGFDDE